MTLIVLIVRSSILEHRCSLPLHLNSSIFKPTTEVQRVAKSVYATCDGVRNTEIRKKRNGHFNFIF